MRRLALGQTDDVMSDDEMYLYTAVGRDVLILRGVQNPRSREISQSWGDAGKDWQC